MRSLIQLASSIAVCISGFFLTSAKASDTNISAIAFFAGACVVLSATILAGGRDD